MDMICTIPNGRKDRLTLTSTLGIGNVGRKDWLMLTSALGNDNVGRKDWLTSTLGNHCWQKRLVHTESTLGNDNAGRKDWLTLTSTPGMTMLVEKTG